MTQLPVFSGLTGVGTFVTFANRAAGLRWPHTLPTSCFPFIIMSIISVTAASETAGHKPGEADAGKLLLGPSEEQSVSITGRPLYLDTKLKEYTTGPVHDITDRVFVIRRAYRVNDSLPSESSAQSRWLWQRGGGLLVDRNTGHHTDQAAGRSVLLRGALRSCR
jgi:hypothetical protein